jgi:hypothetical protein
MHGHRSFFAALLGTALTGGLVGSAAPVRAQERGVEPDLTGFYVNLGANIGAPEFDGPLDGEVGGGVAFGGGYRVTPWLAAELEFDLLAGSDVEVGGSDVGDAQYWAITANVKGYPFSAFEKDVIPAWIQPYARFGMGGGEIEVDFDGLGEEEDGTFVARFGGGIDFLIHRHWGAYVDGGFHVASEDDLDGVGIFTVGAFYRF